MGRLSPIHSFEHNHLNQNHQRFFPSEFHHKSMYQGKHVYPSKSNRLSALEKYKLSEFLLNNLKCWCRSWGYFLSFAWWFLYIPKSKWTTPRCPRPWWRSLMMLVVRWYLRKLDSLTTYFVLSGNTLQRHYEAKCCHSDSGSNLFFHLIENPQKKHNILQLT